MQSVSTYLRVDALPLLEGDSLFLALAILDSKESPAAPPDDLLRLSRGGGGEGDADRDPDADRLLLLLDGRSLERDRDRDRALRILDRGGGDDLILCIMIRNSTQIYLKSLSHVHNTVTPNVFDFVCTSESDPPALVCDSAPAAVQTKVGLG